MAAFDFRAFWSSLDDLGRAKLAHKAELSVAYISTGLISSRKVPRPASVRRLAAACCALGKKVTEQQLYLYFHERHLEAAAEKEPLRANG
ncbi:hypothetical protein [Solimonas marina]|uniref:Uncharacterized protein n=1 Tax=Solimonas marina TaxID=2714601 RepID=A0A969W6H6_9GAMM|nr:hypothetical protein [Solimonas marina]NKF21551.1 hypothetical protein [Solimonas marina]